MRVYIAPEVADVEALHPYLVDQTFRAQPIREQIAHQANTVLEAHRAGDERVRMHLMSWLPEASGKSLDEVMNLPLDSEDTRLALAREYGFSTWNDVDARGNETPCAEFERALDHLLAGDVQTIEQLLRDAPKRATQRSVFAHRATLLHYLGANGVESHRQKTPRNAATLAELLIRHGADPTATANMYGGGQTPYMLASTSAHPMQAGVARELNHVLDVARDRP